MIKYWYQIVFISQDIKVDVKLRINTLVDLVVLTFDKKSFAPDLTFVGED